MNEDMESLSILSWLVKSRTVLIQRDSAYGKAVGNYRPTACLNQLWNLETTIIADKLYQHLDTVNLLLEEQKCCRHASRGTKDQLLIDKAVIRNCKRKKANLNMAWVKLTGAAPNAFALPKSTVTDWKTELVLVTPILEK